MSLLTVLYIKRLVSLFLTKASCHLNTILLTVPSFQRSLEQLGKATVAQRKCVTAETSAYRENTQKNNGLLDKTRLLGNDVDQL